MKRYVKCVRTGFYLFQGNIPHLSVVICEAAMSIQVMNYVWEHSRQSGSDLLMLLAIADHANDEGVCWPSIARLARKARVSERQAQYIIKRLVEAGELEVERGAGRGHTSLYIIKGAAGCTFHDPEKAQPIAPISNEKAQPIAPILSKKGAIQREKVQSSARKGAIAIAPEPSIEPSYRTISEEREPVSPTALTGQPPPLLTEQQEFFLAICEACGMDHRVLTKSDKGQVAQTMGILRQNGYTLEDVRRFMTDIWFHDWRWEKKQSYPTLTQLRQEIGKLRAVAPEMPAKARASPNGKPIPGSSSVAHLMNIVQREREKKANG